MIPRTDFRQTENLNCRVLKPGRSGLRNVTDRKDTRRGDY
jgi:hypothetical protein